MIKFVFTFVFLISAVSCSYYNPDEYYTEDVLIPAHALPPDTLVRARRQVFGGFSSSPGGGSNQQFGYRGSVFSSPTKDLSAWGSLSQSSNGRGFTSPITYGAGTDFKAPLGGLSASAVHIPSLGSQTSFGGSLNILDTPKHHVDAFASHTKTFDPNFSQIGRGSSTGGLNYNHASGAAASVSGTHTPGFPNTGSITGSVPLFKSNDGKTNVNAGAQVSLQQGQKPNYGGLVSLTHNF